FVDPEISTQADGAQSSRVPVPLPEDPYEAISTPPACHVEASEDSDTSDARSTSSDSTAPLSLDHLLTRTSPTPIPTRASFCHRTTRMTVRAQPVMSPGHLAKVTEDMALSNSAFHKRYRSSYETPSPSSTLPVRKRYRGTSESILDTDSEEDEIGEEDTDEGHGLNDEGHGLDDEVHGLDDEGRSAKRDGLGLEEEEAVPEGQQQIVLVVETAASEPLGLGYGALRRRELVVEEDQVYSMFEVGQGSGSVPEPERLERVSVLRQPTLTTWIDPEDGSTYIDVPAYPPLASPVQTSPSPEWSSGSLPVSPIPSTVPSPISSPMISLTVPSPIALLVATPTATIPVDEDQFIEIGAQDVRELYTRSRVVRDKIFSQRYRFRSLEHKRERNVVTFGALWRPVLALEAWARHVDTRMIDMSRAGYDDYRLVHEMLVQQAALQQLLGLKDFKMIHKVTAAQEVILNGDSPMLTRTVDGVEMVVPPTTAE
ncbi:hypothetical protein Tco_0993959, partial [Tanacetum coccineum]